MPTMTGVGKSAATLNIPLLDRLRASAGEYIPIEELGSDNDRVLADLDALAAFGFAIERHPYRGVAFSAPAKRLCPDQIEHALGTSRLGRRIAVWERVPSTNDLAAQAAGSTCNDGLVILAEEQTAGRGRQGRAWTAPPRSSILISILIFPPRALGSADPDAGQDCAWLTALGAVATAEVVSAWIGREAAIKWPNDVRVNGRKIAGILVERPATHGLSGSPESARIRAAVIGIGLNVNVDRGALPAELEALATSIQIERHGFPVDRSEVASHLIRRLDHWYDVVRSRGCAALNAAWLDRNKLLGQVVRVTTPDGPRSGRLVDLDVHLGLSLEDAVPPGPRRVPLAEVLAIEPMATLEHDGGRPWTEGLPGS
jgi:BirA family biotin operon repressor/biotin-[acetyl-CoA-carboxylase] ligase